MVIRQLTVADATEWWYLRISAAHDGARGAGRKPGGWSPGDLEALRLQLSSSDAKVLGAFGDDGSLMAVVSVMTRDAERSADEWLDEIYVMPAWRRRGLGRRLVMLAIALHEGNATLLRIRARASREHRAALALLRSVGFLELTEPNERGADFVELSYEFRTRS